MRRIKDQKYYRQVGKIQTLKHLAFRRHQLDPQVGQFNAFIQAEQSQLGATQGDPCYPDIRDPPTLRQPQPFKIFRPANCRSGPVGQIERVWQIDLDQRSAVQRQFVEPDTGEGLRPGEVDRAKRRPEGRGGGGEGAVGDARAEGEVEAGDGGVADEDPEQKVGPEGREGPAVAGLGGVEGLADKGEGFLVNGVGAQAVEDQEEDLLGEEVEGVALLLHFSSHLLDGFRIEARIGIGVLGDEIER